MTDHLTPTFLRHGSAGPLPARRELRAGGVSCVLENADLRYVRVGGVEVVLRLYMAVRDRNWETIPPVFTAFAVEESAGGFSVRFAAEHVAGEVDFAWEGTITGSPDGTIRYAMDGAARKPFLRNRIGLCVLHPMSLAGLPATVGTPEGTIEAALPDLIAPHQPFLEMVSLRHAAGPAAEVTIAFEGDLFETEDQRNWTDASYKSYGTPLRLPYPVEVTPADRITQAVTISVAGTSVASPSIASTPSGDTAREDVTVDPADLRPLPPIGLGAGGTRLADEVDIERLRAAGPANLWVDLDLGGGAWRERLATATANAGWLGVPLELSVVAAPGEGGWGELAAAVAVAEGSAPVGRLFAFPAAADPITHPRVDLITSPETLAAARGAFAGTGVAVGGGARTYFTELNRGAGTIPLDRLDAVTYTLNPSVHAVDTLSLIETLAAQGETVRSTRALVGDRPLTVGPITFRPPFNPNATGPAPEPGPDALPDSVDPRQLSLLGAGWTLGSIARLAAAGADALTYFELTGWRGLMERREGLTRRELFPSIPGGLYPLFHVFAAVASFGPAEAAAVTLADGLATECLALCRAGQVRLLVANLTDEARTVRVSVAGLRSATVRTLDESTYVEAADDATFLAGGDGDPVSVEAGTIALPLGPFAVARVDGSI